MMSRRSCFLSVFLMLVAAMTLCAFPSMAPYGEEMTIYYGEMTEEEQELYDLIYEGAAEFRKVIGFPHGYDMDTVDKVVSIMMDDSPELFWLDHSWASSYYDDDPEMAVDVEIDYIMSEREAMKRWNGMIDFFNSIEFEWDSDLIDELYIIDAIAENTEYADGRHVYDASSSLIRGKAVCEGYAKAATLLFRLRGIRAGVIGGIGYSEGSSEPHAWNIVRIGDEWTLLDITWIDEDPASYYDWINLSEKDFRSTHVPENEPSFYNSATSTYEIAGLIELYSVGNTRNYFLSQMDLLVSDNLPLLIYYETDREYRYALDHMDSWLDEYNEEKGEEGFYGSYHVSTDDDRRRIYLDRE